MKKLFIIFLLILLTTPSQANTLFSNGIKIENAQYWGKSHFKKINASQESYEWTFNRPYSTLIISKSTCNECTALTISDVVEINKINDFDVSAILVSHKFGNGIYQVHKHPKSIDFFVFKLFHEGFNYQFQLGINKTADKKHMFELNIEFLKSINSFTIL